MEEKREALLELLEEIKKLEEANGSDLRSMELLNLQLRLAYGTLDKEDFEHYKEERKLGEIVATELWALFDDAVQEAIEEE